MRMRFGDAMNLLNERPPRAVRLARSGWNGKGMWVQRYAPDKYDPAGMLVPSYIEMYTTQKTFVPWVASQTDMAADDWERVDGSEGGEIRLMTFGDVLKRLEADPSLRFARASWQRPERDSTAYVGIQMPDGGLLEAPYMYIVGADGRMPFVPGPNSLLAKDWYEVKE